MFTLSFLFKNEKTKNQREKLSSAPDSNERNTKKHDEIGPFLTKQQERASNAPPHPPWSAFVWSASLHDLSVWVPGATFMKFLFFPKRIRSYFVARRIITNDNAAHLPYFFNNQGSHHSTSALEPQTVKSSLGWPIGFDLIFTVYFASRSSFARFCPPLPLRMPTFKGPEVFAGISKAFESFGFV